MDSGVTDLAEFAGQGGHATVAGTGLVQGGQSARRRAKMGAEFRQCGRAAIGQGQPGEFLERPFTGDWSLDQDALLGQVRQRLGH